MEKRRIGKSDIQGTVLTLGAWAIGGGSAWGDNDDEESIKTIHAAIDAGINWIDTAPAYSYGHSEEVVGRALKGRRDKVILSSKCGLQWYEPVGSKHIGLIDHSAGGGKQMYRNLSPASIRRDLEYSLKRLQTDYIDVYYTHWQSSDLYYVPIEETMGELLKMKQEGKIRAIGASNVCVNHLKEYLKHGGVDIIQEKFSIIDRKVEKELLPFCEANHISLQAYSPIEQGLLSGKITMDYQVKHGDARDGRTWWKPENRKAVIDMIAGWSDLVEKYNCTPTNLVINWSYRRSPNIIVLVGARKVHQIEENIKSASFTIEQKDLDRMTNDADRIIANVVP